MSQRLSLFATALLAGVLLYISCALLSESRAQAIVSEGAPTSAPHSGAPLEITADGSLEWDRTHRQMTANGNALARQGATSIAADRLTADYRGTGSEAAQGGEEIWRLGAEGNVRIKTADSQAFGDRATYDLDRGVATLSGRQDKAQDTLVGGAKVLHAGDTLESRTLTAYLERTGAGGQSSLNRVEAQGRVVITTPNERVEGDRGVYMAKTQTATLTGNVRITRGQNTLRGHRAEVNLATNISRLFGTDDPSNRVHGVFYPDESKTAP
jgi:lipopolysaccharide export system protein LptA